MATAQQIFDQAVQMSNLNDDALVTEAQWLDWLTTFERRVYLWAARFNPDFFGKEGNTSARSASTDNWSLTTAPGNVAAVSKIEVQAITGTVSGISVGDDVNIISIRDPLVAISPRVYIRNKTVHEYNEELQDDSSNYVTQLKVYYSHLPSDRTATSDSLSLPEEFNDLLVLPMASRLALRDQRADEAGFLHELYSQEASTFFAHLGVFDEGAVRELERIAAAAPQITAQGG